MHAPSLHKRHIIDLSAAFLAHHQKVALAFAVLLLTIMLMYGFSVGLESLRRHLADTPGLSASVERAAPLTRMSAALLSEREYFDRAGYLADSFGALLEDVPAERVYLAVYENVFSKHEPQAETQVTSLFEMNRMAAGFDFGPVQGISRMSWLNIHRHHFATRAASAEDRDAYGLELYNERGDALGYLGIELLQDVSSLREQDFTRIQRAADAMKTVLSAPLETLGAQERQ